MAEYITLTYAMTVFRFLSLIISMAMIVWWFPSLMRVLRGRGRGRDSVRGIWVTLAVSILLFQVRWLTPGLDDITRMRIWVVAQGAMTFTQVAAIYHHGALDPRFDARRTMAVHVAMLALCVVFAGVVR